MNKNIAVEWLKIEDVMARYQLSRSGVYKAIGSGAIPPAVKLSRKCSR